MKLTQFSKLKELKIFDVFAIGFSLLWMIVIFFDYLNKHEVYLVSIERFQYPKLVIFLLAFGIFFAALFSRKIKFLDTRKWLPAAMTVITLYTVILACSLGYSVYFPVDLTISNHLTLLYNASLVGLSGLFILFACFSLGNLIRVKLLPVNVSKHGRWLIDTALGIMFFTFILFLLGSVHLLYFWTLLPIMLLLIGINYKSNVSFIKKSIFNEREMSFMHALIVYAMIVMAVFNFIVVLSPFPLGFDSRNLYVNLSNIIADNNGLVYGFQPHNWELFAATGKVIFQRTDVTIFISYIAGVLSAWSIYFLSKSVFKLSSTNSALIALLLLVTPAVSHQMFAEHKVDLGLLFIQLTTLTLFLNYQRQQNPSTKNRPNLLIIIGLLLGFGLGIKLLNLLLIYGIVCALGAKQNNKSGLFSLVFLGLGFVLLLKLDNLANLRQLHKYADPLSYILIILGIGSAVYFFKTHLTQAIGVFKKVTLLISIAILTFSPWMIKSFVEMKPNQSYMRLIQGQGSGHAFDFNRINSIYEDMLKRSSNEK